MRISNFCIVFAATLFMDGTLPTTLLAQTANYIERPTTELEKQAWALCDRKYGAVFSIRIDMERKKLTCRISPDEIGFSHKNWAGGGTDKAKSIKYPSSKTTLRANPKTVARSSPPPERHPRKIAREVTSAQKAYCNKSGPEIWDPYTCPR